jgi:galactose mutarotase-like enzyme
MSSLTSQAAPLPAPERADCITLRSLDGSTKAEFVPGANMVCGSLRYLGAEYLHQGAGVEAYVQSGMTMGIPLLHPWANRLNGFHYRVAGKEVALPRGESLISLDDVGLPIHGAMPALMPWEVGRLSTTALTGTLHWTSDELLRLFPFPHELTIEARVDSGALTIATTLVPVSEESVPVSFGYHPYLRIPNQARSRWRITLGARERLLLDEAMIPTGEREPVAGRSFTLAEQVLDDAFDALDEPPQFEASAGNVALRVRFVEGYSYAQVYAPADQDFICLEPMTAPTNALVSGEGLALVPPGQQYRAAFRVSISGMRSSDPREVVQ